MNFKEGRDLAKEMWDELRNTKIEREKIIYDYWLEGFIEDINKCSPPIIDLGCGSGNDTLFLINKGKKVIPCDFSKNTINNIIRNFPEINDAKCFDMVDGLPFIDDYTDIIIADLSLHYFCEKDTIKIINEVERVLKKNGLLIFRVNSMNDKNYGAGKGKEIEKHFYQLEDGTYKRFFDKEDIKKFFEDFEIIYLEEKKMNRYEKLKITWVGVIRMNKDDDIYL